MGRVGCSSHDAARAREASTVVFPSRHFTMPDPSSFIRKKKLSTSLMRLSSSANGFSKSRTAVFSPFSAIGSNRESMVCSHSLPPRLSCFGDSCTLQTQLRDAGLPLTVRGNARPGVNATLARMLQQPATRGADALAAAVYQSETAELTISLPMWTNNSACNQYAGTGMRTGSTVRFLKRSLTVVQHCSLSTVPSLGSVQMQPVSVRTPERTEAHW